MENCRSEADPYLPVRPLLSRRDLIRASFLAAVAAALGPELVFAQDTNSQLTPTAGGEDYSKSLADPNWKPVFLSEQQNETLIALSDVVIPATDTPGAKEALVNRYLDLLISAETAQSQERFTTSLTFIDSECKRLYGVEFRALNAADKVDFLRPWAYPAEESFWMPGATDNSGQQHLGRLKSLIAAAYYSSEIGLRELGWDGSFTHGPFLGCQHSTATHK